MHGLHSHDVVQRKEFLDHACQLLQSHLAYATLQGNVSASVNQGNMRFWGSLGAMLLPTGGEGQNINSAKVLECIKWLQRNNPLMKNMIQSQARLEFFGFSSIQSPGMLLLKNIEKTVYHNHHSQDNITNMTT
jgi:hypothetical protein